MSKLIYIDLETSGLDHEICAITQLSAIYEKDGKEIDRIDLRMRPNPEHAVFRGALDTTNLSYNDIMKNPLSQYEGYLKLLKWFDGKVNKFDSNDKLFAIGYNIINFDAKFLRKFFEMHDNNFYNSYIYYPEIDVVPILAFYTMESRNNTENFKQMSTAKALGIEVDETKAHEAMYDCIILREIYRKLIEERD